MSRRVLACVVLLLSTLAVGCDDETTEETPPPVQLPDDPDPEYSKGHWSKAQRGLTLDRHDIAVVRPTPGNSGITPEEIERDFGRIVLNRLLVEFIQCPSPDEAAMVSPLAKSQEAVEVIEGVGVTVSAVAVNVAVLNPNGKELLHVCLQSGAPKPRFDVLEHRENILAAFRDLARLENLTHITVGVELNRYFHLEDADTERTLEDDYSNLATLYRQVYAAIKEVNGDVKVGPGISWAFFQNRTVPQMVAEYALEDEDGELSEEAKLEAVVRANTRTIRPFVIAPDGSRTADYIGVSLIPFVSQPPFDGSPGPEDPEADEDAFAPIAEHYRYVRYLSQDAGVPIVLPRIDWPTPTKISGRNKSIFLTNLKRALSHVDIEWAAWRRTVDLPQVQLSNTCAQEMSLGHPIEFCFAGLMDETGDASERTVLDNLLQDP